MGSLPVPVGLLRIFNGLWWRAEGGESFSFNRTVADNRSVEGCRAMAVRLSTKTVDIRRRLTYRQLHNQSFRVGINETYGVTRTV